MREKRLLTLAIHREVNLFDRSIGAEYFAEVALIDILGEFLDNNLW